MITDYNDILIHPKRGKKEKRLPGHAILVPNPAEAFLGIDLFRQKGGQKRFMYNSTLLVDKDEQTCIAGPCLGAPAAALIVEKLIVLGVKSISLFSCCGSIDREFSIGDVVLATSGVAGEGVTPYYGGRRMVNPSENGIEELRNCLNGNDVSWKEGGVWSTDAPYRESRAELDILREQDGIVGVDMEFTALCSIASFRGIDFGGLFIVSDELWGQSWKPGFTRSDYKKKTKLLLSNLITYKIDNVKSHGKNI